MPKYLLSASYSAEGLRGLQKDKASGRRQAVTAAVEGLGGKVECFYNALGADDVYVIVDLPDNSTAAAIGVTVGVFLGWGLSRLAGNYVQELKFPGPVPLIGSAAVIRAVREMQP